MSNLDAGNGSSENEPVALQIVIRETLEHLAPRSDSCCIYKVPEKLRCLNADAYTPRVVSIGPLYNDLPKLQGMEEHKYRYLKDYLVRTQVDLESYIQIISSHERNLRSYYEETIPCSSDDFTKMILVDSAFILEFLLKDHLSDGTYVDQRIIMRLTDIISDLHLLENQLPFFILEALFDPDRVDYGGRGKLTLVQVYLKFFRVGLDIFRVGETEVNGEHFLDMVRNLYLPSKTNSDGYSNNPTAITAPSITELGDNPTAITAPSITELHQAGVKIKPAASSDRNLFSIKFENGILEIPEMTMHDESERLLRNLIAYEQCHCQNKRIADYVALLDDFINIPNDVELLIKYGVVTNHLGDSNEACSMINGLAKNVDFDDLYFTTLRENLHKHCKKPWNKWKANLRQSYLNTPWAILSVGAAAFLIILTVIQTVCSLISL